MFQPRKRGPASQPRHQAPARFSDFAWCDPPAFPGSAKPVHHDLKEKAGLGGWIGSLLSGDCYRMNKVEEVICVQSLSYAAFLFRSLQEGSAPAAMSRSFQFPRDSRPGLALIRQAFNALLFIMLSASSCSHATSASAGGRDS